MITLNKITKCFGKGNAQTTALRELSLKIEEGELLAIMGPSGSGKSTLLNIIGCLETPTSGDYCLQGKTMKGRSSAEYARLRNECFGFIVQDFALVERYSAEKNIAVPLAYSKKCKQKKAAVDAILEEMGIQPLRKQLCCTMSGGQRQRVAIARALVNDPSVILADEPTGSLDSKTGQEILDIFKKIHNQGKTVILVTHDERIAQQCGRTIHIVDGALCD